MIEKMTKKDLKERMVVETREGNRYLVCGTSIIRDKGYCNFSDYNENLTSSFPQLDIVKIYETVSTLEEVTNPNLELLWEREEEHEPQIGDVYLDEDGDPLFIYNTDGIYYYTFMTYTPYEDSPRRIMDVTYGKSELKKYKFVENRLIYAETLAKLVNSLESNKS